MDTIYLTHNLLPMSAIIAALIISFGCFWYLQFGVNYDRWWGLITVMLGACFIVLVYGTCRLATLSK